MCASFLSNPVTQRSATQTAKVTKFVRFIDTISFVYLRKLILVRRKFILPLFLVVQLVVLQLVSFFPEFVERFYSSGCYPVIARLSRRLLGSIPFSVGDVLYFILIFMIGRWLWKIRKTWRLLWKDHLLTIVSGFSVFYFMFHLLWATNYYRVKMFDRLQMAREYSDADLLAFTQALIARTNEIQLMITKNDSLKVVFPYTQQFVFNKNLEGYRNLATMYPYFAYENPSVKKSLISLPLTYMGFAGYLNPFTNEAQVNDRIPMYNFPTTTTHEMAHQIGFASESEANFIGYLASIKNDDLYFKYSGYSFALRYCLRNWKIRDEKTLRKLLPTVHYGILENYKESDRFWEQHQSFIETGFKVFYDNFLKFNSQKDGLESYSKFVDLMVNYYKTHEFK